MWCTSGIYFRTYLILLYLNDLCKSSNLLKFVLFADDTNTFYENSSKNELERNINNELIKVNYWFMVNRLS